MRVRAAILALSLCLLGCTAEPQTQSAAAISGTNSAQCMKDTDCKGDRICDKGTCKNPQVDAPSIETTDTSAAVTTARLKDQDSSARMPPSAVGSDATCEDGTNDIPALGSSYNDGIYLCREPIESYWNDWYASRAGQDKLLVQSEGKTSGFSGNLIFNCSTGASSWDNASDFDEPLATERDIAAVVPLQVVTKAMQHFCKG